MTTAMFEGTVESSSRMSDVLSDLLDFVVAGYTQLGATPPDRRYRTVGEVAVDCEQLVLTLSRIYAGQPGQETPTNQCVPVRTVEARIEVHRCVPVPDNNGNPPSAEDLDAAGAALMADAWVVRRAAELFAHAAVHQKNVPASEPISASGGFAGISQPIGLYLL